MIALITHPFNTGIDMNVMMLNLIRQSRISMQPQSEHNNGIQDVSLQYKSKGF